MMGYPKGTSVLLITLVLLHHYMMCSSNGYACNVCQCHNNDNKIIFVPVDCSNLDLLTIPDTFPKMMNSLNLSYNQLSSLNFSLSNFPFLTSVDISYNNIKDEQNFFTSQRVQHLTVSGNRFLNLSKNAFSNLPSLRTITGLQMASFSPSMFENATKLQKLDIVIDSENLDSDIFSKLTLLEKLHITCHQIITFPEDFFHFGKESLQTLYIYSHSLQSLSEKAFVGLLLLENLSIIAPRLKTIPETLFFRYSEGSDMLTLNLKSVSLSWIQNVPENIFYKQERLEKLELHGIANVYKGLLECVTLDHLDLFGSYLADARPQLFQKLQSLKYLNLNRTNLSAVESDTFVGLDSLLELRLASNQLTQFKDTTFDPIENLEILDVRNNKLRFMEARLFLNLRALKTLDMSKNELLKLDSTVFHTLGKLEEIDLSQNMLATIPRQLFYKQINLLSVNMSQNKLSFLPKDLFKKSDVIRSLDLSHNKIKHLPLQLFCNKYYMEDLYLIGNPIHCDCEIFNIQTELPQLYIHGVCASPLKLRGKLILEFNDTKCELFPSDLCNEVTTLDKSMSSVPPTTDYLTAKTTVSILSQRPSTKEQENFSSTTKQTVETPSIFNGSFEIGTNFDKNKVFGEGGSALSALFVALVIFGAVVLIGSGMSIWYRRRKRQRSGSYEVTTPDGFRTNLSGDS